MKDINNWGVLLKEEASYGAGGTVSAATDGLLVLEEPLVTMNYAYDGQRRGERGPRNVGIRRVSPGGRSGEATLVHEGAGGGAAYSSTVVPSFHLLLRILGFSATLDDGTPGSESYTYALGNGISALGEFYARGEMAALTGILGGDLTIEADGPVVPMWTVPIQGIMTATPTDASVPAITYPSVAPPKAENIQLALGSFASAVVRSFSLQLNRQLGDRIDQNAANGHAGFAAGARRPTLETLIEADSLVNTPFHTASGLDPYQLQEAATAIGLSLVVGGTQYERYKVDAATNAQLVGVEPQDDDPTALWRLTWEFNPSTPGLLDNFTIVAD